MGKSMRKFKKLAALAITIPTLLSSTNISFAMKSPVQSNVHAPQEQSMRISLNQLSLGVQGSVLFNKNVPYDNAFGFITILNDFTPTGTQNIFIANGLLHDAYGRIYNENEYFTYANGKPIQLPLQQQQFEVIPSEQYHYNTVDNSPFEQENMETQNTLNPQRQTIHIPLNQLYLDGQGSVLFNPNVPYDNTYCFITIQPNFTHANTLNIFIVNSLRHDAYGRIYNENGYFTYNNGQPVQLPLPQQQFEVIPSEQCHYNTVFNSQIEQEEIQEQNEQVEDNKSPKPPKSTQKTAKTRKYCKDEQTFKLDENGKVVKTEYKDCIRCKEKKCVVKNGTFVRRGIKMQRYLCKKCQKNFILYENGKVVKKELKDCIRCKEKECAAKNGTYKLRNGTKKQLYFCTKCKKYFTQPINKNAEEQAGIEIQPN